jgi:hypothetical protein
VGGKYEVNLGVQHADWEANMKRHLLKLAIASAVLVPVFATAPAHAQATRTWVSGVGDDVNPCSRTAPCKTFAGAISKTAANGKINCLDPGGFGAVTITKSIEIDCLQFPGGILNAGTNGVNVSTTAGIKVVLRGIEIHGGGTGINGVNVVVASEVTIDKCFIIQQTGNGINVNTTVAGTTNLIVLDTVITTAAKGIALSATGGGAVLGHIRNVNIHKVTGAGIELVSANSIATVSNSMLTGNATGANVVAAGNLNLVNNVITYNTTGVNAGGSGALVKVSDNKILNNNTSWAIGAGAQLSSGGDNKVDPAGPAPNGPIIATQ